MSETRMLFQPIQIKSMRLKNRLGFAPFLNMPGVFTEFAITDETVRWFEQRAQGGTGLIMTGGLIPMIIGVPGFKEGLGRLAEVLHSYDAKLGVQLVAGGPMSGRGPSVPPYPDESGPTQTLMDVVKMAPGLLPPVPPTPESISVEEILMHEQAFADTAAALKEVGVDCVELHCAHGGATLCCSFISPYYNKREDEYGGSWENRLRLPVETIRKMREAVGEDYPLLARISADELLGSKGITLADTVEHIVPALEKAGVDCIDVSQGDILRAPEGIEIPLYYERGCYIHHAEAVKKATSLPVIGVGRIVDLDMAEQFLQDGKADLIYLGRQITSDPETPTKYFEGRPEDIRKCIACCEACGTPCSINYDIGPGAMPLEPAERTRSVVVIGGGVAGMEAARVCTLRGHRVTLFEQSDELGGMVAALALDPLTREFGNFTDYLSVQLDKLGVDVRLSTKADTATVEKLGPDAVIVATGSSMTIPPVAKDRSDVMDHIEALRRRNEIGKRVVVWGFSYGAELAISLAEEGKDVTLIGEGGKDGLGAHGSNFRKFWVLRKLADITPARGTTHAAKLGNPKVLARVKVKEIGDDGVRVVNRDGEESVLAYDTLIVSRGRRRNNALVKPLKAKLPEVHEIGDCASAANILRAVTSANEVARTI
jgi:2,4-dienoyl-CoA reductase-like NADH-dependent reductase (Old Yellow Enzyme family)/thioredoxin reductase